MTRPEPPPDDHEGYEWVPVAEDGTWRLADGEKRCRMVSGHPLVHCPNRAVAELNRQAWTRWRTQGRLVRNERRDRWYAYCPEHMYSRWVEDGVIMCWRLRPIL